MSIQEKICLTGIIAILIIMAVLTLTYKTEEFPKGTIYDVVGIFRTTHGTEIYYTANKTILLIKSNSADSLLDLEKDTAILKKAGYKYDSNWQNMMVFKR